jgi:hypothetical protein
MEQLSLSLLELRSPHAAVWEALAHEQRVVVIEALARLLQGVMLKGLITFVQLTTGTTPFYAMPV